MSTPQGRPPRIVAELGRPETAEETAARKTENSRAHRANQTTRNLVLALAASVAVALVIVLLVVRTDQTPPNYVDYRSIAAQAQPTLEASAAGSKRPDSPTPTIAVPDLPKSWRANDAQLKPGDGPTQTWYIGLITPKSQFIALEQGIFSSDAWYSGRLGKARATGSLVIDGTRWTVYNRRTAANPGNFGYSLAARLDGSRYLLHGSADNAEFAQLASAVTSYLAAHEQK